MAATMPLQKGAKILPFRKPCEGVKQTDRQKRLPALSSADIESLFDNALKAAEKTSEAA